MVKFGGGSIKQNLNYVLTLGLYYIMMNTEQFKLSGFISEFPLFEVIQFLGMIRKKGALRISWENEEDTILLYIDNGNLLHAANHRNSGTDVFFRALEKETGYFKFSPMESPDHITIDQPLNFLLLESQRRLDELRNLSANLPPEDMSLFIASDLESVPPLNTLQWKILSMVNGRRTLKRICEKAGDELETKKILLALMQKGVITGGAAEDSWHGLTPLLTHDKDVQSGRPWPPLLRTNLLLRAVDNVLTLGELQQRLKIRDSDFFGDIRLLFETNWIHFSVQEEKIFFRIRNEI